MLIEVRCDLCHGFGRREVVNLCGPTATPIWEACNWCDGKGARAVIEQLCDYSPRPDGWFSERHGTRYHDKAFKKRVKHCPDCKRRISFLSQREAKKRRMDFIQAQGGE